MLGLNFRAPANGTLRILCLGAHSDDIEIGCGGTLLRVLEEHPRTEVHWVVCGASGERESEARESAKFFLKGAAQSTVVVRGFRDGFFPYDGSVIKEFFETLKRSFRPDLVLTHYRDDRHQDHRVVSELTWNTFRDHTILEYEIPKYDGDLGSPNLFVPLREEVCRQKISHIMASFHSQAGHTWFTEDTFFALLRLRGIECNAGDKYAEAFYGRKIVI